MGTHQNIHHANGRIPLFAPSGTQHTIVRAGGFSASHHLHQWAHIIVCTDGRSDFFVALTGAHQNIVGANGRIPLSGLSLQSFYQASCHHLTRVINKSCIARRQSIITLALPVIATAYHPVFALAA
jgi:hypothetical protein